MTHIKPTHLKPLQYRNLTPEQITAELKVRAEKVQKRIKKLEALKRLSPGIMQMTCCK